MFCLTVIGLSVAMSANLGSISAYTPYIHPDSRSDVIAALGAIDHSEEAMNSTQHVVFVSAESSSGSLQPIVNRIHYFPGERFDVWLMRQRQKVDEGWNASHWSAVGIVVDKHPIGGGKPLAQYLEFASEPVLAGELPRPITPKVPCYRCHPNGPRAIRPTRSSLVPELTANDLSLIARWNESIANSGVMETYMPENTAISGGIEKHRWLLDPIPLAKCKQCHEPSTGIRSQLHRIHAGAILFLSRRGADGGGYTSTDAHGTLSISLRQMASDAKPAMPIGDAPLTDSEADCLEDWLSAKPAPNRCDTVTIDAAVDPPPSVEPFGNPDDATYTVDQDRSTLKGEVETTFGTFTVNGLSLGGWIKCAYKAAKHCRSSFSASLDKASTGIGLRDKHLKQLVADSASFPYLTATTNQITASHIADIADGSVIARKIELSLNVKGHIAPLIVPALCKAKASKTIHCSITSFPWDMRHHDIDPPKFLGLRVSPRVLLSGDIVFRPNTFRTKMKGG